MIVFPPALLRAVIDAAEAAYPEECCGLLAGRVAPAGERLVTRVVPSANVAESDRARRFELDAKVRFDLMRALRAAGGTETVLGLYHSHPDGPAQPSAADLETAWEPKLTWVIVAVAEGQAIQATAHQLDPQGRQFRPVSLRTDDWQAYPSRPALDWNDGLD